MEMFESRRYRTMERITNLMLLNAAWLVASLPLITMFPATAALFGAVREIQMGVERSALSSFWSHLRENFRQALVIGFIWSAMGALLLLDYVLLGQVPTALQLPLFVIFSLAAAAFLLTSVYVFPVMVSYRNDWKSLIRNAFFVSISQLHTSIACLLIVFVAGLLASQLPLTLLLTASTTAYLVHAVCARGLRRVERLKDMSI